MITQPLSSEHFQRSVIAVPPLARNRDESVSGTENERIVRHLEAGGVSILLYGGNANFYHLPPREFEPTLALLARLAGPDTLVIPRSVRLRNDDGPARLARGFNSPR
jgi:dihydrodipicolinate synthase/N-acetylneuraminate lyase